MESLVKHSFDKELVNKLARDSGLEFHIMEYELHENLYHFVESLQKHFKEQDNMRWEKFKKLTFEQYITLCEQKDYVKYLDSI